jgi:DNA repair protein RadA/Sms
VVFLGEVSLTGEIRPVSKVEERIKEAARLGYRSLVLSDKTKSGDRQAGLGLLKVRDVSQALAAFGIS